MKILVIQQKMIGDVLTSSALLKPLKKKFPNSKLDFLINTHTFPVVDQNPYVDNYIFFTPEHENSFFALVKLGFEIRKKEYDIVIDVYCKLSSNLLSLLSNAKKKISYYKYYSSFLYTDTIKRIELSEEKKGLALVHRNQLLDPLNISTPINEIKPKIYLTEQEISNSKKILDSHNIDLKRPLFMISVLGSSLKKTYPFRYMAKIIDTVVEKTDGQILFNYIPKQKVEAQEIFNLCNAKTQSNIHFDLYGKTLREFLALTSFCSSLIGNEGGAINMAKALEIPTFTIFSPGIEKNVWNIGEDGKKHVSTHLDDFESDITKNKTKDSPTALYEKLTPKLILPILTSYLENNSFFKPK